MLGDYHKWHLINNGSQGNSQICIERIDGYIEERVFENFQNFREPRFKMSESGFWVFSRQKEINIRTDNLRVHMVGSDTRTMSIETTACSG
jgi:hypothetical protein